jgi:rubredoxin
MSRTPLSALPDRRGKKEDLVLTAQCPECGFLYRENTGNEREGFPPGTPWSAIPDDWNCPDCAVRDKLDFIVEIETLSACVRN